MEIKTKLNIDDEAYYLDFNKVKHSPIKKIVAIVGDDNSIEIHYDIEGDQAFRMEDRLFKSKEELLKSL